MRVPIPQYAKEDARKALELRRKLADSRKFGIDKDQAAKLGINSGVERAKQIIRNKYLDEEDARRVAAFYDRFRNKRGERAEGAIDLWGGRRFGRMLSERFD